jgi:lysophospholipase L1-like esterase
MGLRVFLLMVALSTIMVACSQGEEKGTQDTDQGAEQITTPRRTTASGEGAETTSALRSETTSTDSRPRWDYVALGDSLAVGVGARRGYVTRYAEQLRSDTGVKVRTINLGVSGQTSTQLLYSLRHDPAMRKDLRGAEIVTLNIGLNDLGQASGSYEAGICGGPQNQACLREAVDKVEQNWDAIIEEILTLRSTEETIIRTAGFGYTPRAGKPFEPYVVETTSHIASTTAENDIPSVEVRLGNAGMSKDELHPNDRGYRVIADRLADLGYEPLTPH